MKEKLPAFEFNSRVGSNEVRILVDVSGSNTEELTQSEVVELAIAGLERSRSKLIRDKNTYKVLESTLLKHEPTRGRDSIYYYLTKLRDMSGQVIEQRLFTINHEAEYLVGRVIVLGRRGNSNRDRAYRSFSMEVDSRYV